MGEIVIRPARAAAAAIAALSGQLGYPSSKAEILERMKALAARGSTAILVAEVDGEVAGWVAVREDLVLESGAFAEIAGLVVGDAHRGRGIGGALVAAAEAWARGRGHTRVRVRSNVVRERAYRFYERLGYTVTKTQAVFDRRLD